MSHNDLEYLEGRLEHMIVNNYSVNGILSKRLLNIIKRETDGDPLGYIARRSDIPLECDEDDLLDITEMSAESLVTLLTLIINKNEEI